MDGAKGREQLEKLLANHCAPVLCRRKTANLVAAPRELEIHLPEALKGSGLSWSAGYILMWMGKWTVGSAITGENLWGNALGTVSERASSSSIGGGIGRILAVLTSSGIWTV